MSTVSVEEVRTIRPSPDEYAPYYQGYIDAVADGDVVQTLNAQIGGVLGQLHAIPESRGGFRYAPGKWSVREVIGHLSDTERIFTYRALRFARGDQTPLAAFDEDAFIRNSRIDERTVASLADELEAVRRSTIAFFSSLFAEEWTRSGTSSGKHQTVRSYAWIAAGHVAHHARILQERYLKQG